MEASARKFECSRTSGEKKCREKGTPLTRDCRRCSSPNTLLPIQYFEANAQEAISCPFRRRDKKRTGPEFLSRARGTP